MLDTDHRPLFLLARSSVIGQASKIEHDTSAFRQVPQQLSGPVCFVGRSNEHVIGVVETSAYDFERQIAHLGGPAALGRAAAAGDTVIGVSALASGETRASTLLSRDNVLAAQGDWQSAEVAYNSAKLLNAGLGNKAFTIRILMQLIEELAKESAAAWSGSNINLGNAQLRLGDVSGNIQPLLDAQNSCLQTANLFSQESTPASWAKACNNFALALGRIAATASNSSRTQIAAHALRNAVLASEHVMLDRAGEPSPKGWEESHSASMHILSALKQLGSSHDWRSSKYQSMRSQNVSNFCIL